MKIERVNDRNIHLAARVHALSWQASHRAFCREDFVRAHTPQRQQAYLLEKMRRGAAVFLLSEEEPVGVVSVSGSLIEDLYVLPQYQNRGFGTQLLQFAMEQCAGTPTLWILDSNTGARRLYERCGFRPTGGARRLNETLSEIELAFHKGENA